MKISAASPLAKVVTERRETLSLGIFVVCSLMSAICTASHIKCLQMHIFEVVSSYNVIAACYWRIPFVSQKLRPDQSNRIESEATLEGSSNRQPTTNSALTRLDSPTHSLPSLRSIASLPSTESPFQPELNLLPPLASVLRSPCRVTSPLLLLNHPLCTQMSPVVCPPMHGSVS
jgi:hypothetical protein